MLWQIIVNGIVTGGLYVLAGISWGLIYTTTGVFHFAHLAVFTIAGFTLFQTFVVWKVPFILSFLASLAVACVVGALIERVVYRPLREHGATQLHFFLTSVGVMLVLQNISLLIWRSDTQVIEVSQQLHAGREIFGIWFTYFQLLTISTVAALWAMVHLLGIKTKVGKAIRALASDAATAELMGINIGRVRLIVYIIGSALIGVVANFEIMDLGIHVWTGLDIVIIAVIASLIGAGWGISGIAIASFSLGLLENLSMLAFTARWKYVFLFGIIIFLLYIRPRWLFKTMKT